MTSHLWHHLHHHRDRTSFRPSWNSDFGGGGRIKKCCSEHRGWTHMRGNTAGSTAVFKFPFWTANGHFGHNQARPTCPGMLDEGTKRVCTVPPESGTRSLLLTGGYVLPDRPVAVQRVFCPVKYFSVIIAPHRVQKFYWTITFKYYFSRIKFLGYPCKAFCSEAEWKGYLLTAKPPLFAEQFSDISSLLVEMPHHSYKVFQYTLGCLCMDICSPLQM